MRIQWGRVVALAVFTGLAILLCRGCVAARCGGGESVAGEDAVRVVVYDHREQARAAMELEEYLVGVVAAEMPASFPLEALKAQAVAARSYTLYHALHDGCRSGGADVCTDSSCCQAFCSDARMREKWGSDYKENREKVERAVFETAAEVLLYEGAPIEALYHSASGGSTENVEDVYSASLPYLRAVMSTAEAGTARIVGTKRLTREAFAELINESLPEAELDGRMLERQVEVEKAAASGRVQRIRLGGARITGRQMRALLSLDSTLFTISYSGDEVVISTKGYGHGVGMSQTGANAMALGGRSYREILAYYYTGVEFGQVSRDAEG